MKSLGLIEILSSKFIDFETKKAFLRLPKSYVCDSVDDLVENKTKIRKRISSLIVPDVYLEPNYNEDDELVEYIHPDEQTTYSFNISDETGKYEILWPNVETYNLKKKDFVSFIENPRVIDSIILIHDKYNDSSFIGTINEGSYERGIQKIMKEIWPYEKIND